MYFVEGNFFFISIHCIGFFFSSVLLRCTLWKVFFFLHYIRAYSTSWFFFFSYITQFFFFFFNDISPWVFWVYFFISAIILHISTFFFSYVSGFTRYIPRLLVFFFFFFSHTVFPFWDFFFPISPDLTLSVFFLEGRASILIVYSIASMNWCQSSAFFLAWIGAGD